MEILSYWRLLKSNKYLILATTLLSVCFSYLYLSSQVPAFSADAQIFVSTPATAIDINALATGSNFSQQRVKSYAQIINSPMTLKPVIKILNLNETPEQLSGSVSASAPLDTVLISLSVTDTDPKRAALIANTIASEFAKVVQHLESLNASTVDPIKVSTVREAVPNYAPIGPSKKLIYLFGILLGIAAGFGISILRRLLDLTIKNVDDLFGLPLLAAIGFDLSADEKPLIIQLGRYAARTEAYRTLRTNLRYIIPSVPAKLIAISSALPGEGKSTTATNLAISFAQGGNKTILVEADLRRPNLSKYLGVQKQNNQGLSNILTGTFKITPQSVKKNLGEDGVESLDILYAGKIPPNPSEILGSERFDQLLTCLRRNYEYVILDSPPLLPVADAAIIATKVDGVLLVVHAGKTKKSEFMGSRAAVESVSAKILGVVLNKIPENSRGYKYGYAYGGNKYYSGEYQPLSQSEYSPSQDELYRIEREEFFDRIAGKRFKAELQKESSLYDKQSKERE